MWKLKYNLLNDEPGAGGGAPPAAPGTPPAPAAPATPPAGSVLGGAAGTPPAGNPYDFVPEKFRVFGEDKAFQLEASAKKISEAYGNLEKKVGSGDLPPETPEGYKIDGEAMGEGFNAEEFMKDEKTQGFLKRMHAKGMTNAQVQEVMAYGLKEWAPDLMKGNQALTETDCAAALKEFWPTDAEFKTQTANAYKAVAAVAGDRIGALMEKYGNDPDFIHFAAQFGREMGEDKPPGSPQSGGSDSIEQLMNNPAYSNPKHPDHVTVSAKVKSYFERKYGKEIVQ